MGHLKKLNGSFFMQFFILVTNKVHLFGIPSPFNKKLGHFSDLFIKNYLAFCRMGERSHSECSMNLIILKCSAIPLAEQARTTVVCSQVSSE